MPDVWLHAVKAIPMHQQQKIGLAAWFEKAEFENVAHSFRLASTIVLLCLTQPYLLLVQNR